MKTIALLLFSVSLSVHSQVQPFNYNYPVRCGAVAPLIEFLSKQQKEVLTWTGLDIVDGSLYSLWEDAEGNWTLLKKNSQIACVLGVGTKPKII